MTVAAAREVAAFIDHTLLRADATRDDIEKLCAEAALCGFAAVCVNPTWVALCARGLRDTAVAVCAVVGFPMGASTPDVKRAEARRAVSDGAREIDMVINIGALKSGDLDLVREDLDSVMGVCREARVLSKVIVETALLTEAEKVTACTLAKDAGADFVKTSTGFGPSGATIDDVRLIRRVVGPVMGIKASGGIRDLTSLQAMLAAGATRIGASGSIAIMREAAGRA